MWPWFRPSPHTVSGCFLLNHLWGMEKAEKPLVEINHGILIRLLLSKSFFIQLIDYWLHFKDPARARKRALWRYQGKCVIMSLISAQHKSASQEYLWKKRSSSWLFRNCHFLTIIDTLGRRKSWGTHSKTGWKETSLRATWGQIFCFLVWTVGADT